MQPSAIRDVLREEKSDSLDRRRKIILLSALGLVDFSLISLYQTGVIEKLPDVDVEWIDSNYVNASESAYQFGAPDGPISAVAYAANMVLASAGGTQQTGRAKIFDWLLAGSVAGNAIGAGYYLYEMVFKQKKACLYCLAGAAINFAMVPLAWKELNKG